MWVSSMPKVDARPTGFHLAWVLVIASASVFVTALVASTGDLATLWPLYVVPIAIAALVYQVAGAVVAIAVHVALVLLLTRAANVGAPPVAELLVGAIALTASALVIGVQTSRHQRQRELLKVDVFRDPSGAYTRQFVDETLARELSRSERHSTPTSLVLLGMADAEEFRRKFGRIRTERMIERLAEALTLEIRSSDIVGRWGPETFAVVLASADADAAETTAARVVALAETVEFEGDALEPVVRCGFAAGAATFPTDTVDPADIAGLAEKRLSEALGARVAP